MSGFASAVTAWVHRVTRIAPGCLGEKGAADTLTALRSIHPARARALWASSPVGAGYGDRPPPYPRRFQRLAENLDRSGFHPAGGAYSDAIGEPLDAPLAAVRAIRGHMNGVIR